VNHGFSMGTNTGINEASLYRDGIVRLRGFAGSQIATEHRWVWLTARKGLPVDGFVWRDGKLWRFREAAGGPYVVFSVLVADPRGLIESAAPIEFWTLELPKSNTPPTRSVVFMLLERERFDRIKATLKGEDPVEVVQGSMQPVDANAFPAPKGKDDAIRIARSYDEMLSSMATPVPGSKPVPLNLAVTANDVRGEILTSTSYRIHADSVEWPRLASANVPNLAAGHDYEFNVDLQMEEGGVEIQLLSGPQLKEVESIYQEVPLKHVSKSFVYHATDSQPLYFFIRAFNVNQPAPCTLTVSNATVQEVTLSR
jgi:hypothetical protein